MANARSYTIAEVADAMQCSASLVRQMVGRGELVATREGGRLIISSDSLSDAMAQAEPGTTARQREEHAQEIKEFCDLVTAPGVGPRPQLPVLIAPIPEAHRRFGEGYNVPHLTYIARSAPFVKIGITSDVQTRFRALVAANPHDVEMVFVLVGGRELEQSLHRRFAEHRHRDEWFREEGSLAEWIAEGCPI